VQALIPAACNGEYTAREIARLAMCRPADGVKTDEQVYELLERMVVKGLIAYDFHIPLDAFPERILREPLDQLGDVGFRRVALAALDELESARGAAAASAGDAERLDRALENLERTFTRLTGAELRPAETCS
jgi:hypothetical protein